MDKLELMNKDVWSLDYATANFLVPRLLYAKTFYDYWFYGEPPEEHSKPGTFITREEWEEIVDQIIEGFLILMNDSWTLGKNGNDWKVARAFRLFGEFAQWMWD